MPPPDWRLREYEVLASTSDLCVGLAQAGEPARLAVLAGQQTAGRGSRGRTWQSLPGNLALSVLLRPRGPAGVTGHWALLAAVALAEALEMAGAPPLRLKWPNDVQLDGRKLGGILLDSAAAGGHLEWLVIGFGANLAAAPDLAGATRLPSPLPAPAVAAALLGRLEHWDALTVRDGFAAVHRAWLARGPKPGAPLLLDQRGTSIRGAFAGLNQTGALLLQSGDRLSAFPTGEILEEA